MRTWGNYHKMRLESDVDSEAIPPLELGGIIMTGYTFVLSTIKMSVAVWPVMHFIHV